MAPGQSQADAPTAPDHDEIVRHMGLYIDGFDDPDNFRRCFHPEAGDVASVVLEMHSASDPDDAWVDFHSLLRIASRWRDTNKTATHASRAAWAAP